MLGLIFKEDCPDLMNSKVPGIIRELQIYGVEVFVHDPLAGPVEALRECDIGLISWAALPRAETVVVAVAHDYYRQMDVSNIKEKLALDGCLVDVKSTFSHFPPGYAI